MIYPIGITNDSIDSAKHTKAAAINTSNFSLMNKCNDIINHIQLVPIMPSKIANKYLYDTISQLDRCEKQFNLQNRISRLINSRTNAAFIHSYMR